MKTDFAPIIPWLHAGFRPQSPGYGFPEAAGGAS